MECQERIITLQEIAFDLLELYQEAQILIIDTSYEFSKEARKQLDIDVAEFKQEITNLV